MNMCLSCIVCHLRNTADANGIFLTVSVEAEGKNSSRILKKRKYNNFEDAVKNREFRADLFCRLNVITIHLPPLREREEDIPLLSSHYLDCFRKKNRKDIREIDKEVMNILLNYDWPGNVRELENVLERAVILCPQDTIHVECLPSKLQLLAVDEPRRAHREFNLPEMEKRIILKALDKTSWNQSQAAILLGISRKRLRTKMKNLGLLSSQT